MTAQCILMCMLQVFWALTQMPSITASYLVLFHARVIDARQAATDVCHRYAWAPPPWTSSSTPNPVNTRATASDWPANIGWFNQNDRSKCALTARPWLSWKLAGSHLCLKRMAVRISMTAVAHI